MRAVNVRAAVLDAFARPGVPLNRVHPAWTADTHRRNPEALQAWRSVRAATTVTDPQGRERTLFRDARDQIVAVLEHNDVLPDGATDPSRTEPRDLRTRYTEDRFSQRTRGLDARVLRASKRSRRTARSRVCARTHGNGSPPAP